MSGNLRGGFWAPTIRYRDGQAYLATSYASYLPVEKIENLSFTSQDPSTDGNWSDAVAITNPAEGNHIDPDLSRDDDGFICMATGRGKIFPSVINLKTGKTSQQAMERAGSGGTNAEALHIYRKDGYHCLVIAEGGLGLDHSVTIARSGSIYGPYESFFGDSILTNSRTQELFPVVSYADLFQDSNHNWRAVALVSRSGPAYRFFPMGRESVLTPVTYEINTWPVLGKFYDRITGPLPVQRNISGGKGQFVDIGDTVDFRPASSLPNYSVHFQTRHPAACQISIPHRFYSLQMLPS